MQQLFVVMNVNPENNSLRRNVSWFIFLSDLNKKGEI